MGAASRNQANDFLFQPLGYYPIIRSSKATVTLRAKQDVTDETLMLRYQRGDVGALVQLVHRHHAHLFNFIFRDVRDLGIAATLHQEVLLSIANQSSNFQRHIQISTAIYSIARNLCVEHLEQRPHNLRSSSGFAPENASEQSSEQSSEQVHQQQNDITSAVEKLPNDQLEVFLLREMINMPFKEIAVVTGSSENTVRSRMRAALERLQTALQSSGESVSL